MKCRTRFFLSFSSIVLCSCVGIPGIVYPISDDAITWSTPALNNTECPNLNGNFSNWDKLYISINNAFTHYNHQANEIPNVDVYRYINEPDRDLSYKIRDDRRALFTANESFLNIVQSDEKSIELNVIGTDKKHYTRNIYNFVGTTHKYQIGCYKNNLIVRKISHFGGVEGTAKSVGASEIKYSRESNGNLKIVTQYRNWSHYTDPQSEIHIESFRPYVEIN